MDSNSFFLSFAFALYLNTYDNIYSNHLALAHFTENPSICYVRHFNIHRPGTYWKISTDLSLTHTHILSPVLTEPLSTRAIIYVDPLIVYCFAPIFVVLCSRKIFNSAKLAIVCEKRARHILFSFMILILIPNTNELGFAIVDGRMLHKNL